MLGAWYQDVKREFRVDGRQRVPQPGAMTRRKGVLLRLDPAVHDALFRWAADELRSTNAQIEFLLRRALSEAGRSLNHADPAGGGAPDKMVS